MCDLPYHLGSPFRAFCVFRDRFDDRGPFPGRHPLPFSPLFKPRSFPPYQPTEWICFMDHHSNAGGIGTLGAIGMSPSTLREVINGWRRKKKTCGMEYHYISCSNALPFPNPSSVPPMFARLIWPLIMKPILCEIECLLFTPFSSLSFTPRGVLVSFHLISVLNSF